MILAASFSLYPTLQTYSFNIELLQQKHEESISRCFSRYVYIGIIIKKKKFFNGIAYYLINNCIK